MVAGFVNFGTKLFDSQIQPDKAISDTNYAEGTETSRSN